MAAPLLQLHGLVKRFGGLLVTDHVDLAIAQGDGKTTLINQIVGELKSDQGRIELDGRDVSAWPVHARARAGLGRSYQITSVIPQFSVLENVVLAVQATRGHNFRFWQPATSQRALVDGAERQLERVGLLAERDRAAEPMAGLGPVETQQMITVLQGIKQQYGILLVEHDMHAVFSLASVCSVLVYGKVVFRGSPGEVQHSPLVREAYLGDEEIPA